MTRSAGRMGGTHGKAAAGVDVELGKSTTPGQSAPHSRRPKAAEGR